MNCVCAHENPDHRGLFFEGRPDGWRCVTCRVCGNGAWLHERFHRHLYNIDHDYQQCNCTAKQEGNQPHGI